MITTSREREREKLKIHYGSPLHYNLYENFKKKNLFILLLILIKIFQFTFPVF